MSLTPIIDMFSGTVGLSRTAGIRLQARLMLQRGLIAINNERNL